MPWPKQWQREKNCTGFRISAFRTLLWEGRVANIWKHNHISCTIKRGLMLVINWLPPLLYTPIQVRILLPEECWGMVHPQWMGSYCLSWLHQEIMHKHGHRASLSREALIETPLLGDFRLCQVGIKLVSTHADRARDPNQGIVLRPILLSDESHSFC